MKHYIFNTEQEALDYDAAVTAKHNYQAPTSNWANPQKHPTLNKWAIAASPKVVLEGIEPQGLTEDWTPTLENF